LLAQALAYAEESGDSYDRVVVLACQGSAQWHVGSWAEAARLTGEAIETHRRDCVRYDFAVSIARGYRIAALAMKGALREAKRDAHEAIEDARARGDLYVSRSFLSGYYVYVALAEDNPGAIVGESEAFLKDLPSDHFTSLHWMYLTAMANALVYAGDVWDAWAVVQAQWPLLRSAGFLRLGCVGAHVREIRARAALRAASAARGPSRAFSEWSKERLLALAVEDAHEIERTAVLSHGRATAAAIRSALAAARGESDAERAQLETACHGFAECGMSVHSAAARLQLAVLAGDRKDGDTDAAARVMTDEGVARPDRMAAFLMFAN
jgi:hypothetical protein